MISWSAGVLIGTAAIAGPPSTPPPDAGSAPDAVTAVYRHAAVAADHVIASQVGVEMLERGGNAVDAAVAASFCLSVVRPYSCGIGGGGFMLIHKPARDGKPPVQIAINFRETAPGAVGPDYYAALGKEASRYGPHAVGVPGTVAGLLWALEHYGTLERAVVLAPAIRAAEEGVAADANHVWAAQELAATLAARPHLKETAAPIWQTFCLGGKVAFGDVIRQPQQARALRLIAERGASAFYRGEIAEAIVAAMGDRPRPDGRQERPGADAGPITAADLAGYTVRITEPIRGTFRDVEVLAMPPPSSGGVAMLQILGVLERRGGALGAGGPRDPAYVHLLVEAMKHAFADRATWLADPEFVDVPTERLLEAAYLDRLASSITADRTLAQRRYGSALTAVEDGGTSHLSVLDEAGMAVACTGTINLVYGSLVTVPGFGFVLNDEMDDFTTVPGRPNAFGLRQSDRNLPAPSKRPLSSMSPTIVLKEGRPVLIAGASGGPRIITATVQCLLNCLLFCMTPQDAVEAARFHHQWSPDVLQFEQQWPEPAVIEALERLGHRTGWREEIGVVQMIGVSDDGIHAASDPRKGGAPAGY